jgi:hypothetical protein
MRVHRTGARVAAIFSPVILCTILVGRLPEEM